MFRIVRAALLTLLLATPGCRNDGSGAPKPSVEPSPAASATNRDLEPADNEFPAAGACGEAQGAYGTMTFNPDIPNPRCLIVHEDQQLKVVNRREEPLVIDLGRVKGTVAPGKEMVIGPRFGDYLAPGVHVLTDFGGEIWLKPR
jgi:hypothetical protein